MNPAPHPLALLRRLLLFPLASALLAEWARGEDLALAYAQGDRAHTRRCLARYTAALDITEIISRSRGLIP